MSSVQIHPSTLKGSIAIAPSKSMMQRVCAAALLYKGKTIIQNPGYSNDDKTALHIIQLLGANVTINDTSISIISNGIQPISTTIDCSESGLSVRMFTSLAALYFDTMTIEGEGSLLKRSLVFFDEVYPTLNVQILSNKGFLPLEIKGPLVSRNISIDGSKSSQYLTGLLMAFSHQINNDDSIAIDSEICIEVYNLNSKPYIDMTLQVMQHFNMLMPIHKNYNSFTFIKKHFETKSYPQKTINIEGDWSGAAFFLVAGAIHGNITVKELRHDSLQADKAIMDVLKNCEAEFIMLENEIIFQKKSILKAFQFDATDCPDLFPPLVCLAAFCNGSSTIVGVNRLYNKESNRALSLKSEFKKLGISIDIDEDKMMIYPSSNIKSSTINSHNDHRIAMACAIAATKANAVVTIENAEAVAKSYPNFYRDLIQLGVKIDDLII